MDEQLERVFARLRQTVVFAETDFSDVNACSILGDNGLHCVAGWGDLPAAKTLIDAGVEINKAGDRGFTPLHVACMQRNIEMVELLIDHGADLFALSEGDAPFTIARLGGHDHVCDFLAPLMEQRQSQDPNIWIHARIAQLRREIAWLEEKLAR